VVYAYEGLSRLKFERNALGMNQIAKWFERINFAGGELHKEHSGYRIADFGIYALI